MAFTINYPLTTMNYTNTGHTLTVSPNNVQLSDTNNTTLLTSNSLSNNRVFDISLNSLTFKGSSGASGSIIMADSAGSPYWTSLINNERQDLYNVLTLNNDASGQEISGLSNLTFTNGITLGSVSNTLSIQTPAPISVNITTGFTGYFPININGNNYYLQLYSVN